MTDDKSKLEFFSKIEELFDSDDYTDLTIIVGEAKFHTHQNLLKIRTPFFANATKPGGFSEAKDNTVAIKEHSAHSVWRFLKYCYTGDYPEESNELALGEENDPGNMKHLRVYALADMLDVPGLKAIAASHIETSLSNSWSAAEFPKIVTEVYSTTSTQDKVMRNVLIKAGRTNLRELSKNVEFKKLLVECGDFSGGLMLDFINGPLCECRPGSEKVYLWCGVCGDYQKI
ncbi:hypothetical protein K440DRAFT_612039 [Wilcoxina mikolae CBS 423.85]|nr:hypothetical protein K440DRAFT_612039 [Wilcoxina mikolae CBS 423.85]